MFMPNLLQEFEKEPELKFVSCPEFVFTSNWSSAGYASGHAERVFGTMVQGAWSAMGVR